MFIIDRDLPSTESPVCFNTYVKQSPYHHKTINQQSVTYTCLILFSFFCSILKNFLNISRNRKTVLSVFKIIMIKVLQHKVIRQVPWTLCEISSNNSGKSCENLSIFSSLFKKVLTLLLNSNNKVKHIDQCLNLTHLNRWNIYYI